MTPNISIYHIESGEADMAANTSDDPHDLIPRAVKEAKEKLKLALRRQREAAKKRKRK